MNNQLLQQNPYAKAGELFIDGGVDLAKFELIERGSGDLTTLQKIEQACAAAKTIVGGSVIIGGAIGAFLEDLSLALFGPPPPPQHWIIYISNGTQEAQTHRSI